MALPEQFLPAITAEQYLELERTSEIRHEFLDGLVYAMAGESPDHSTICFNLASAIGAQIRDKPCRGFSPNMKVRAGIGGLYAYPDLMIVCGEANFHDEHGDVLLNPAVIFEVLSPSTEKYDRGEKFRRYRTEIESLQDYVLVSQDQFRVEHHHREADGAWSQTEAIGRDGAVVLKSIDCMIPLTEVYRNTDAAK
ncbi:MAG TPA: Uma2 family endonuclease [Pyrinomonadaceae bacterium]|jgi:Uma2 family endonuclease